VRKAQGGVNAAILVAIIAGLIMLYIIFLPEDEREALLENKTINSAGEVVGRDDIIVLLREFPGHLNDVDEIEDVQIPNMFLYEATNAEELEKISPFIVRNGWFDKKSRDVRFSIEDPDNTDNTILVFNARKHTGTLAITLNGNTLYEQDLEGSSPPPIHLRSGDLRSDNILSFSVSGVGARFWQTNEYILEDVKIIGDVTDRSKSDSRSIFTLTSKEYNTIEKSVLRFVPYCGAVSEIGILDVEVNGNTVFSGVPVCEDPYRQVIPVRILKKGANTISFSTTKGAYSIEQIELQFEEEDVKTDVFFFELNQTDFDDIFDDELDVNLILEFVNDHDSKRADINVNNHFITLDQDERFFERNIRGLVEEGNNFVEIEPRTDLEIVEIRVQIEEP